MKRSLLVAALFLAGGAVAQEPDGFVHWSAKDLAQHEKDLAGKVKDNLAGTPLGNFGNHATSISLRTADGASEVHEGKHDFFFVQSGAATLITGGTLVEEATTGKGERRGKSIKGGKETALGPGDVVHIPAGMPHQLLIKKGGHFTYFVIKVDTAPPAS
jgi:mannose-6-phosphate isomerase-like protein (cupin superfamily)